MNENQMRDLLQRSGDRLSVGPPPHDAIATLARRRRNRAAMGTAALLMVVTIGGGAVIQQVVSGETDRPHGGNDLVGADNLDVPAGMRLVGMGQVVVAVPADWSTGETQCLKPVADTVYFESGAITRCADEPSTEELRAASSLAVSDYERGLGGPMSPSDPMGGWDVLEGPVTCEQASTGTQQCQQAFAVPDENVAFRVTASGEVAQDVIESIRGSLQILPSSYTAVPLSIGQLGFTPQSDDPRGVVKEVTSAIERDGLQVKLVEEYRTDLDSGSYLRTDPALGSPIPVGGTVTLIVSTDTVPTGPGHIECLGTQAVLTQGDLEFQLFPQSKPRAITLIAEKPAHIVRSGPCAADLHVGPATNSSVIDPGPEGVMSSRLDLSPGTTTLTANLPSCAGSTDPSCRDGIGQVADYEVTVEPANPAG